MSVSGVSIFVPKSAISSANIILKIVRGTRSIKTALLFFSSRGNDIESVDCVKRRSNDAMYVSRTIVTCPFMKNVCRFVKTMPKNESVGVAQKYVIAILRVMDNGKIIPIST